MVHPKTAILIRHGETEENVWNQENPENLYFGGQLEATLTAKGREQARLAGQTIRQLLEPQKRSLDAIFTSPLQRAQETAKIVRDVLPSPQPLIEIRRPLIERGLGILQGKKQSELRRDPLLAPYADRSVSLSFEKRVPGGENYGDVLERVAAVEQELLDIPLETVLIISHRHTLRCLIGIMLHLPDEEILNADIQNATPMILERRHDIWVKK